MKVMHFIPTLQHGGAERLLVQLLPYLKKYDVYPYVVCLFDITDFRNFLDKEAIRLETISPKGKLSNPIYLSKIVARFNRILLKEKPDIIHSHLFYCDILAKTNIYLKSKIIITLHSIDPWWDNKYFKDSIKKYAELICSRARKCNYIAVSESVKEAACSALRLNGERIRVVPNGIYINSFTNIERTCINKPPIIIQVGNLYEWKGYKSSLEALKIIVKRERSIKLRIVGEGPFRTVIEDLVSRLKLENNVEILGKRDDVAELLRDADIFWLPSEREGMPLACIEAMASGLPVIASNAAGIPEVVLDGVTGFIIPIGDFHTLAMRTLDLLSNEPLWLEFSKAGKRRALEYFDIKRTAEEYVRAYRDTLSGIW